MQTMQMLLYPTAILDKNDEIVLAGNICVVCFQYVPQTAFLCLVCIRTLANSVVQ